MTITIDDLVSPPSADELRQALYDLYEGLGLQVTTWHPGDPTRTLTAATAQILAVFAELQAQAIRGGFRDDAEEGWLELLSRLMYGVDKITATFATVDLTFDNAGGGVFAYDPGEVIAKNPLTGKTYVNTAALAIGALETGVICPFIAQEAGSESNAGAGDISELVTAMLNVTVTNATAASADDTETNESLRERDVLSLGALSPDGPSAAYEFIAKTPALNGGVAVTRARQSTPAGDGTFTLWIAGSAGAVGPSDVATVQDAIDELAVTSTATCTVESATPSALTVSVDLYVPASAAILDADWESEAKAALIAYVDALQIGGLDLGAGGKVLWRALVGVLEALDGGDGAHPKPLQATLGSETDVALAENEVATLDAGDIAITVHQVTP